MKNLRKQKAFIKTGLLVFVFQIASGPLAVSARADLGVHAWGNQENHNTQPCPEYLDPKSQLPQECRGSQMDSVCHAVSAMDSAADWALAGAVAYTPAAAICWVSCTIGGTPQGAWANPTCSFLTLAAGAIDIAGFIKAVGDGDEYSEIAKDGRSTVYKAADAGGGALSLLSALPIAVTWMQNATGVAGGVHGAVSHMRVASGRTADSSSRKGWACFSAAVATAMMAWKWTNFGLYIDASNNEVRKVAQLKTDASAACHRMAPQTPTPPRTPGTESAALASSSSGGGSDPRTSFNSSKQDKLEPIPMKALTSAALADGGLGIGQSLSEHLPEIAEAMEKNMGVTPQNIADAIASGSSPIDVLSKMIPDGADAFKEIADNKNKVTDALGISSADLYASAGGGAKGGSAGPAMPDLSALFGPKKDGGTASAGGVSAVQFGKLEPLTGDIWHIGTKKSLFEIVSDKWSTVVKRFIREDSEQNFMANQAPTGSVRAPASTGNAAPR